MDWKVDFKELIPFLGRTIYKPENVLVELCANCYDADASIVDVSTKGQSRQILIKDDGCGMNMDDLNELVTIAKSRKRTMIENDQTTPKFNRRLLGSFGIGIVSFFALGDFIRFFTLKEGETPIFMEIKKILNEDGKIRDITISDPSESDDYKQHLLNPENCSSGTTIEINNNCLDFIRDYDLIRYKLSNLPLSNNFKIKLNDIEIKRDDFNESDWLTERMDFTLDNIDPSYQSNSSIHVNFQTPIYPSEKRGVYLEVNGRVIEKDLYAMLYPELTSPAAIAARVRGLIQADYLQSSIQANREDFFDTDIISEIKNRIKTQLNQITEDYKLQRYTEEKQQNYNALLQRMEKAKHKFQAPNENLSKLGLNFASNPEYEQEVVLIIAQLCQIGILPFQILDYNSGTQIDCIVKWPITHIKRDPDFIAELEVETSLSHFFEHEHDFRTKPDICCWEIKPADFERRKLKYKEDHPESIVSIELKDAEDAESFGHQKELHFTVREAHNELRVSVLRVYVLSEIVESLS